MTTKTWLDGYDAAKAEARRAFVAAMQQKVAAEGLGALSGLMGVEPPEPTYDLPLSGAGETAVYVLARRGGEGTDRTDAPGDLRLTETEVRDILALQQTYKRFCSCSTPAGVVDLSPVVDKVANILLLSPARHRGGDCLCRCAAGQGRALRQADRHLGRRQ